MKKEGLHNKLGYTDQTRNWLHDSLKILCQCFEEVTIRQRKATPKREVACSNRTVATTETLQKTNKQKKYS